MTLIHQTGVTTIKTVGEGVRVFPAAVCFISFCSSVDLFGCCCCVFIMLSSVIYIHNTRWIRGLVFDWEVRKGLTYNNDKNHTFTVSFDDGFKGSGFFAFFTRGIFFTSALQPP